MTLSAWAPSPQQQGRVLERFWAVQQDLLPCQLNTDTDTHLSQLLMDAQVVHHHDPIHNLQKGLVCDWLIGFLQRSPQQQAIVTMAPLDYRSKRKTGEGHEGGQLNNVRPMRDHHHLPLPPRHHGMPILLNLQGFVEMEK